MIFNSRQKTSDKKLFKRPLFIIIVFIVVGMAIGIAIWSNSSGSGSIDNLSNQNQTAAKVQYKLYSGRYVRFSYKDIYSLKTLPATDQDLENAIFTADTLYNKSISLSVKNLPEGNLSEDSSYEFRKVSPNLYTNQIVKYSNFVANEWTKVDGSEITVFITKGDTVAILSFLTGNPSDQLQPEVNDVLSSFSWQ